MTQLRDPLHPPGDVGAANVNRWSRLYTSWSGTKTFSTTQRILGLWVPAACFRPGTVIVVKVSTPTAAASLRMGLGGPGGGVGLGVTQSWTTPAAATNCEIRWAVDLGAAPGGQIVNMRKTGFYSGATSAVEATAVAAAFLQPVNFVEFYVAASTTVDWASMEVIMPHNSLAYGPQENNS